MAQDQCPKSLPNQRAVSLPTQCPKRSLCFLAAFISALLLLQIHALNPPLHLSLSSSSSSFSSLWLFFLPFSNTTTRELNRTLSLLRDSVTLLPLKDPKSSNEPTSGRTWFMSSIDDTREEGEAEHLHFPSEESKGRLLCLLGRDVSDGARNSYALAWPEALPRSATFRRGLTFVSDAYYDYGNLWHGLSAMTPFVRWHERKGCAVPARWVLFHKGELRTEMSPWIRTLLEAVVGEVNVEGFEEEGGGERLTCFEEAVVFRHNQGTMAKSRKRLAYDMMRCKARAHCNVTTGSRDPKVMRMTLLLRRGSRSFKNETVVIKIFERECGKVDGCRINVAWANDLTFCDQVKLMSGTDILVSPHGAQMTNLIFMDPNSSIMELYPKGWKELAGNGQFVFRWLTEWAGMRHQGSWWDSVGEKCPHTDNLACFFFYKDTQIGHDETYFTTWASKVLKGEREFRQSEASMGSRQPQLGSAPCPCS